MAFLILFESPFEGLEKCPLAAFETFRGSVKGPEWFLKNKIRRFKGLCKAFRKPYIFQNLGANSQTEGKEDQGRVEELGGVPLRSCFEVPWTSWLSF